MYNPFSLENKIILVTGASSGIGKAIAIECSKMGAKLIIVGRNRERTADTFSQLEGEGHTQLIADLTNASERQAAVEALPKLDGVVHCAGISKRNICKDIEEEEVLKVMNANFTATVMLQKLLLSEKKINKAASIVFLSSRSIVAPATGNAIYSASKGAITSYAKVLGLELSARKIRVNCICPAMVWTPLITEDKSLSVEEMEERQKAYPLGRYGKSEDIAYLAIYLLSNASDWMTGSCIDITGGGEHTLI